MIIDMHCDTISVLFRSPNANLRTSANMVNLEKLQKSDYLLQCFAMFVPLHLPKENYNPFEICNLLIDRYYKEIAANPDLIAPVFRFADILKNRNNHKVSSLLTIEEGGVCKGKLEFLRDFYRLGVRMIALTWNFKNEIASPNIDRAKQDKTLSVNTTDGLTPFGIEFVKEMNRLGMVIDCSHIGDKGFFDVIKYSTKPIVCSHSCSRYVCNHPRNLTDAMLLKLKANGGVVGINFNHDFVKKDASPATIADVIKHIDHIKAVIGVDHIGLGSDFDGIGNDDIEIKDATFVPKLLAALREKGYSDVEIDKIAYQNVLRVLKANLN